MTEVGGRGVKRIEDRGKREDGLAGAWNEEPGCGPVTLDT